MKRLMFIGLLAALSFGLVACIELDNPARRPPLRFSIINTDLGVFKIDTETGDSWKFVAQMNDKSEIENFYWTFVENGY